jgi:hypothetical protein
MSAPIEAYVGANGSGKSLAAVVCKVVPSWREGRLVVSNFWLDPTVFGFDADLYRPLQGWRDLERVENCTLILDEISRCLPSRGFGALPVQLVGHLNQLRKVDVDVAWLAPNWARADVTLREVTQHVTVCRGAWPDQWQREFGAVGFRPRKARNEDGKPIAVARRWRPNRLFTWRTYDARELDEFTFSSVKDVKPLAARRYWRPSHKEQWAYRTLDSVDLLDHLDDVGICVVCNGTRSRPKCSCRRDHMTEATPHAEGAAGPTGGHPALRSVRGS